MSTTLDRFVVGRGCVEGGSKIYLCCPNGHLIHYGYDDIVYVEQNMRHDTVTCVVACKTCGVAFTTKIENNPWLDDIHIAQTAQEWANWIKKHHKK